MRPDLEFTPSLPQSLFSPLMVAVVYLERSPPSVVILGGKSQSKFSLNPEIDQEAGLDENY